MLTPDHIQMLYVRPAVGFCPGIAAVFSTYKVTGICQYTSNTHKENIWDH